MSLLMDTQTNRFWARVDFLATGEIVLHIPEEFELPIRVLVSRGGRSTEYEPSDSEKPNNSTCSKMEQVDEPKTDCNGCKFVGTYDTEFPCANCSRKTKDYYATDEPQTERSE